MIGVLFMIHYSVFRLFFWLRLPRRRIYHLLAMTIIFRYSLTSGKPLSASRKLTTAASAPPESTISQLTS